MTEEKKSLEYEAGSILVDDGIRFRIPFIFGTKLPLLIKPLLPGSIVKISQQVTLLKQMDEGDSKIQALLATGTNYKIFARIIAIAAINRRFPLRIFTGPLTGILLWKVRKPSDMLAYVSLVYRQMDAERFFFIMALTGGMNYLAKKNQGKPGAVKPSGEHSQ